MLIKMYNQKLNLFYSNFKKIANDFQHFGRKNKQIWSKLDYFINMQAM